MQTFIHKKLNPIIRGWGNYFRTADTFTYAKELDRWIRRRLRIIQWRQWGRARVKYRKLIKAGVDRKKAFMMANSSRGPCRMSKFSEMSMAYPPFYFANLGLVSLSKIVTTG